MLLYGLGTRMVRNTRCTCPSLSISSTKSPYCSKSIQGLLDLFQKAANEKKANANSSPALSVNGTGTRTSTSSSNFFQNEKFIPRQSSGINAYGDRWSTPFENFKPQRTVVVSKKPVLRNYYNPHPEVDKMTPEQVAKWRSDMAITIEGNGCPNPILQFKHTPFTEKVIQILTTTYRSPTIIQSQGWPVALSSRDMIGSAETGSGKTLAFILPAFEHIKAQPPLEDNEGPIALVMAPTRELAQQIESETTKYSLAYKVRIACVFGGQGNRSSQLRQLAYKPHLVVATPGRLLDYLNLGHTNLSRVSYLVLDEADRMLDMGFEPQIREIVNQISTPERQTLMWSATWPRRVQGLARDFFKNPIRVNIGSMELSANPNVIQKFIVCDVHQRYDHVVNLINESPHVKTLIFVSTKLGCNNLGEELLRSCKSQLKMAVLHGDKNQIQRNNILSDFRKNYLQLVVATDVAARGLDVTDIGRVINFDFPMTIESYIHRIGRTARGGRTGESISFFTPNDFHIIKDLIDVLNQAAQPIPMELQSILRNESGIKSFQRNYFNR